MCKHGYSFEKLVETVEILRSEKGCPWDRKQTLKDLKIYLTEEVYELCEAVDSGNENHIAEEAGDVLLNLLMIANVLKEKGLSDIYRIADSLREKIINRHPHVFGDKNAVTPEEALKNWHHSKKDKEKKGLFKNIPSSAPPLEKAYIVSRRAEKIGFGFENEVEILNKLKEEFQELVTAIEKNNDSDTEEEMGDLFFTLINLAVHKGLVPQDVLNKSCNKFLKRMQYIEDRLDREGKTFQSQERWFLETLWEEAKSRI